MAGSAREEAERLVASVLAIAGAGAALDRKRGDGSRDNDAAGAPGDRGDGTHGGAGGGTRGAAGDAGDGKPGAAGDGGDGKPGTAGDPDSGTRDQLAAGLSALGDT